MPTLQSEPVGSSGEVVADNLLLLLITWLHRTFISVIESLRYPRLCREAPDQPRDEQQLTAGYIVTDVERLRAPVQHTTYYLLSGTDAMRTRCKVTPMTPGKPAARA